MRVTDAAYLQYPVVAVRKIFPLVSFLRRVAAQTVCGVDAPTVELTRVGCVRTRRGSGKPSKTVDPAKTAEVLSGARDRGTAADR